MLLSGGSVGAGELDSVGALLFRLFFARWGMGWTVGACIVIASIATFLSVDMPLSAVGSMRVCDAVRFTLVWATRLGIYIGTLVLGL